MNKLTSRWHHLMLLLLTSVIGLASHGPARADAWPSRPVKIVVPFPAGGGNDSLTRLIAEKLRVELNQSVVVENKGGGGGNLGSEFVARSPADGYTFLMGDNGMAIYPHLYPKLTYDPIKDFVPVGAVAVAPILLVSNSSQPYKTLTELMGAMRPAPGKFDYAFGGLGTPQHLAGELFNLRAGVKFTGIPYRGSAPALQDVLSGQVGYGFFSVGAVLPHIRSGKLRAYGVALPQRSSIAPDIPTFAEQGVPDMDVAVYYFLCAPANTPPDVLSRMAKAVETIRSDKAVIATFTKQGLDAGRGTQDDIAKMLAREGPKWGELIRAANIKPE